MPVDAAPGSPTDLQELDRRLVQEVASVHRRLIAERRVELGRIAPEALTLMDSLERYLDGGKLLRPRFCFFGGLAAQDGAPDDAQISALARCGAAIELVQAAALMHDDVIDHSPTRRGRPALHVEQATDHRERGMSGSSDDFGVAVAIVLGDLTLSWAEQLFSEGLGEGAAARRSRAEFDALRTEVMCGQYLDILHQAGGLGPDSARSLGEGAVESGTTPEEAAALQVIRWKTVPYTVLRPVRIGAALMGADDAALDLLSRWAIEVGTAFQLRDDLLSVVGDEDHTGKPTGGDIIEGKRTVLLARTVAEADETGIALLQRTVGVPSANLADVHAVHELMVSTGAVASVSRDVAARAQAAQDLLAGATELGELGRAGLSALAGQATDTASLPA
ncbi:polyprenyl synthetase family protein [Brachybacterium muris]|uniref:polyprenyl synthetase family protein n=1 Tax=Brachybacterium muris TaxID=219301 RepID=UPI0021A80583|nr:polyprenyl synthetase family protein [Brachybacterium muris]MCT1431372.1 polyprenyl synthetase family protein [Brachybacterium muris]